MKYLIYATLVVYGLITLLTSYIFTYGIYWQFTNKLSNPMPWFVIVLCGGIVLVLITAFIILVVNVIQLDKIEKQIVNTTMEKTKGELNE